MKRLRGAGSAREVRRQRRRGGELLLLLAAGDSSGATRDVAQGIEAVANPVAITLVPEKQVGEWKIVHTHGSNLVPPRGP